jgi:hypothetical protein
MSELVLIMYIADVAYSLQVFFGLSCFTLLGVIGCWVLFAHLECELDDVFNKHKIKMLGLGAIALFFGFLSMVIPSKVVIYAYAGAVVLENQFEQMQIDGTLQSDLYKLVRKKIKDELTEQQEGEAK